jgi:hypothetical protein
MLILSKLTQRFNPKQNFRIFLKEIGKPILKFTWKSKAPKIVKIIMKKNNIAL